MGCAVSDAGDGRQKVEEASERQNKFIKFGIFLEKPSWTPLGIISAELEQQNQCTCVEMRDAERFT